jgi:signal transduction histidine kinase
VEDTGPGVAPDDLARVFDRFYEADPARDRAAGHSGLGLAIVKALVEAHGGQVGVRNAAGAGACFWFALPSAPAAPPESPAVDRPLPAVPVRATWP